MLNNLTNDDIHRIYNDISNNSSYTDILIENDDFASNDTEPSISGGASMDINKYIACKAIVGDGSDNIPSACFQVGEKTAPDLYKLYEDVCIRRGLPFPTTEEDLAIRCKEVNISKRKAYLNFNENQFLINESLTNLQLVDEEIDENLLKTIYQDVNNSVNKVNNDLILEKFTEYQFNSLNQSDLVSRVESLRKIILEDDNNLPEMIKVSSGLFDI